MAPTTTHLAPKTVLVTGANGYIGSSVCRSFVRAGWRVIGLVRRASAVAELTLIEAIPVVGTLDDLSWVDSTLLKTHQTFDVVVNCLETFPEYKTLARQVTDLATRLAKSSVDNGVRTLVLWSSGCKDYGLGSDQFPHTEELPIKASIPGLLERAETSLAVLDGKTHPFDGVVLRPTSVFGYTSSYYGGIMRYADEQRAKGEPALRVPIDPDTPMHGTHVDDCGDAYVALAEHPNRAAVAGQAFNISGYRYETVREIFDAVSEEYGFPEGAKYVAEDASTADWFPEGLMLAVNFPQWVGSEKIRSLTGWKDRRMLFSENIKVHRAAYEAEELKGHGNLDLVRDRMADTFAGVRRAGRE